jgi:hypothetical protein
MTDAEIVVLVNVAGWDAVDLEDGFGERIKKFTALIEKALREGDKCPSCEYNKLRAQLWRHEAYRAGGAPLPWEPDGSASENSTSV